jgi:hypothetical protein
MQACSKNVVHTYARAIEKVASRYAPSRLLSFGAVHVFVALQLMQARGRVSRDTLAKELWLGSGAVKTLVKHMKMSGLIETSNGGTRMTAKGRGVCEGLTGVMPSEMSVPRSSVALGKYNYAVLLKELGFAVRSGIEQRDAAIRIGGTGATTLLYRDGGFAMPDSRQDPLKNEPGLRRDLVEKLGPQEGDAVVIGGADGGKAAELAAKNAALATIMAYEKHA